MLNQQHSRKAAAIARSAAGNEPTKKRTRLRQSSGAGVCVVADCADVGAMVVSGLSPVGMFCMFQR